MKVRNLTELFSQAAKPRELEQSASRNINNQAQAQANSEAVRFAQDFGNGPELQEVADQKQRLARIDSQVKDGTYLKSLDLREVAKKVAEDLFA